MDVRLRVLGRLEVWVGDRQVELGGPRRRALLARLAVARGSVVSTDRLIEDLWDGAPPEHALGVVHAHVSTLRRLLEPDRPARSPAAVLLTQPPGYLLRLRADADDFGVHVDRAAKALAAGDLESAMRLSQQALDLWGGAPYEDIGDRAWLTSECRALEELRLTAQQTRLSAGIDLGNLHSTILELEQLVEQHPLREAFWRLLALSLYRSDRQADALAALRRARDRLVEELGLDPGQSLQQLEAAILSGDRSLLVTPRRPKPVRTEVGSEHPLLGREAQLQAILAEAQVASARRSRAVLVSGEPGMGKSRLVEAASAALEDAGWLVAWGRSHEYLDAPALWPWHQVLVELRRHRELPAALETMFSARSASDAMDVASAQFAQHHAIAQYLSSTAGPGGLVVVLEDLQWADVASLALLEALTELAATARLLLLGTYRSGEESAELGRTLDRMSRQEPARILLTGLSTADVRRLMVLHPRPEGGPVPDAFELERRTGGNPFLLIETLRELATSGASPLDRVPEGAAGLVRRRLIRLSGSTQELLRVAAVCGSGLDERLIGQVAQVGDGDVVAALDEASGAGLLVPRDDRLEFAHDLVRETLYADLSTDRRQSIHARVVTALERRLSVDPANLATHARKGGSRAAGATVRWASAAAEQASRSLAYDDAVRWWTVALRGHDLLAEPDLAGRVELLLHLAHSELRSSDSAAADGTRKAAVALARQGDDPLLLARALTSLDLPSVWAFRHYGDLDEELVALLLDVLEGGGLPEDLQCRLLATLANELAYGDPAVRDGSSRAALSLATGLDEPGLRAFALTSRFLALEATAWSSLPEMRRIGDELLRIGRATRLPGIAQQAEFILSVAALRGFDVEGADGHVAVAAELVRRQRPSILTRMLLVWSCARHSLAGDFAAAGLLLDQVEADPTMWAGKPFFAAMRAMQLVAADRAAAVGEHLDEVADFHAALAHDLRVLHLHACGDVAGAERLMRDPGRPAIPDDWVAPAALVVRGLAAAACGSDAQRAQAYEALSPGTGQIAACGSIDGGPTDWVLGQLAGSRGNPGTAREHWTRLEQLCGTAGLDHWRRRAAARLAPQPTSHLRSVPSEGPAVS
jgi:DNA-binding SARP family transcriptional activator